MDVRLLSPGRRRHIPRAAAATRGEGPALKLATIVAAAVLVLGCGATATPSVTALATPTPTRTATPVVRVFTVTVNNQSARPATLVIGRDGMFDGHPTGTVDPSILPPGITEGVVLGIPAADGWAIYINPGPDWGPSITWRDVPPDAAGQMPFSIVVTDAGWGAADANPPGGTTLASAELYEAGGP